MFTKSNMRAGFVKILGLLLFLVLVRPAHADVGPDWFMAGANPQRTSWVTNEVTGNLGVKWYRKFEPYIDQKTQIIAVDNKLYIATANGLIVLNAQNGQTVCEWRSELPLGHSPTVYNGTIYIGGFDHKLHALRLPLVGNTCTHVWSYDGATAGYHTSPLVVPDSTGQPVVYIGNRDGKFYAINGEGHSNPGQLKWSVQTDGQINYSAAYSNGMVYFASDDDYAYAVNAETGSQPHPRFKMTGDGFHSWWPVVYKDKVIFAQTSPYRESRVRPNSDDSPYADGRPEGTWEVVHTNSGWVPNLEGTYLGDVLAPASWSNGYSLMDAHRLTELYERMPNSTSQFKHKYWMRPYVALKISDWTEWEFDSDNDGFMESLPFSWWAKPGSNINPPVVDSTGNLLYAGASFTCCSDAKGKIYSWTDTDPGKLGLVGTTVSGGGIPSPQGGWGAMAEPLIYSGAGNRLYWVKCCDREGVSFNITGGNPQTINYFSYSLPQLIPNYDKAWYIAPTAISRHIGWYDGFQDFYPDDVQTWRVRILSNPQPAARPSFNPGANGVFYPSSNTSQTVTVTAAWDVNNTPSDPTDDYTEDYTVTINRQSGCNTNITTFPGSADPNPGDGYAISIQGEATCLPSNSINGQYGNHGDQNPLVPHNGMLFTNRSNTIVAFGSGTPLGEVTPDVTINNSVQSQIPTSLQQVRDRLESEVQKVVSAGLMRPAYTTSVLHNFSDLANYFTNPGDTLLSLSMAYPYLSPGLQTQVRTYLQSVLTEYFGTGADTTMYAQTGWAGLAARENTDIPIDIQDVIPTLGKNTQSEGGTSWQYPPYNFYAMYVYASTLQIPAAEVQTLYTKAKSKIPQGPTFPYSLNEDSTFSRNTSELNAWITGYTGYLHLQELAGQQADPQGRRTQITAERDRLLNYRRDKFDKNSIHAITSTNYLKTLDLSRNFLYMNPELGSFMASASYPDPNNTPQVAINEYEYIAPYWFVAKYEAMFGESGSQNLFQLPAIFQAKAWIEHASQAELIKYLDAPAFPRGDLYYIQDAAILLSVDPNASPFPSPSAAPSPLPDANGDGQVDTADFDIWKNNYSESSTGGNTVGDFNGNGKVEALDFGLWFNAFTQ